MQINKEELEAINLNLLASSIIEDEFKNYFLGNYGEEHYKLLAWFASKFNDSLILDIGTYKGCSALALSYNLSNKVKSFDIRYGLRNIINYPSNIEFIIDDILDEKYKSLILSSKFILLDTDHDGAFEYSLYNYLKVINYKGYLMIDDIKFNSSMEEFWTSIVEKKYDISHIGHHSGTGLVIFS
jgi:hypothetical protein